MRTLMARELWEAAHALQQEGNPAAATVRQGAFRMWLELTLEALRGAVEAQKNRPQRGARAASILAAIVRREPRVWLWDAPRRRGCPRSRAYKDERRPRPASVGPPAFGVSPPLNGRARTSRERAAEIITPAPVSLSQLGHDPVQAMRLPRQAQSALMQAKLS